MRVNPGNPDQSYIVQKIEGNAAVGGRMPLGPGRYLPQDRIDLIRRWIAAGAPPRSRAGNVLIVTSSVSRRGEIAPAGTHQADGHLQRRRRSLRARAARFELRDGIDQPVPIASARVSRRAARTWSNSRSRDRWRAGSYQLTVRGDGPVALADTAGHVLDGDADGDAGGDFLMSFDVSAGASR